jgi:hypothetical protein
MAPRNRVTPSAARIAWKRRSMVSLRSHATIQVPTTISSPSREACR